MKHLGSGKTYERYDDIQPELLEAVPRSLMRDSNKINVNFFGFDVWHSYEFYTQNDIGIPIIGVLKIVYPADSKNIVESKSLKLYLTSWNFHKATYSKDEDFIEIEQRIKTDLINCLKCNVDICLHFEENLIGKPLIGGFRDLSSFWYSYLDLPLMVKTDFLRSNCRVTGQADYADLYIYINGSGAFEKKYLTDLILSFRTEMEFHEGVIEKIYQELKTLNPKDLLVAGLYTRRGGIDINPIRASRIDLVVKFANNLITPTILTLKSIRH